MHKQRIRVTKDQSGIVSIMVTLIIMIILSLIVLGFAQLMRREQRQSLDYQLSTQAFYAAEAGINDAVNAIKSGYNTRKEQCEPDPPPSPLADGNVLDAASGIAYTCLLVDPSPPQLVVDVVDENGWITPMKAESGVFSSITIGWEAEEAASGGSTSNCPAAGVFPANADWPVNNCDAGLLRVDLVPVSGGVSRTDLVDNTMTAFFYPRPPGEAGTIGYGTARGFGTSMPGSQGQGAIVPGKCGVSGASRFCEVTITGLSVDSYYLRLKSIYKPSAVTITGRNAVGPTRISGSQAVVDSTGKANDILRRIQVRVPLHTANDVVPDALRSVNPLCKRFRVAPDMPAVFRNILGCNPTILPPTP